MFWPVDTGGARAVGLRVARVERKQAYQADVVHVAPKEVAFDHLRDHAARTVGDVDAIVLRGLALFLARQLQADVVYLCSADMQVSLTKAGQQRLDQLGDSLQGAWRWRRYRHERVICALQALHVFRKDVYDLVRDEAIHFIDTTTGRLAVGRSWSRGLRQMIAIKEGVPPQPENETLTQTNYQSFFPRYLRLAGLSGTLYEARAEMLRVYGLPICKVPLRVPHQVLNARQDEVLGQQEQSVVAQAGQAGCITVATHMAGRGTDVHLSEEAVANGGLHVINTNLNRSRRIDRQLIGRCACQGMPGSRETILSREDDGWREWAGSIATVKTDLPDYALL